MPKIVFCFLLSFFNSIASGMQNDTIINPIVITEISNGILKQEVLSILRNNNEQNLDVYKTKIKKDLSVSTFRASWNFYVQFAEKPQTTKNKKGVKAGIYILPGKSLIKDITFLHVKVPVYIKSYSLNVINDLIQAFGDGNSSSCAVQSYISKDRYRSYLHLYIESDRGTMNLIFIIMSSKFYGCLIEELKIQ